MATPTLSVDASQARLTAIYVMLVVLRLVGTLGGSLSVGIGGVVTGNGADWPELLPAASKAATVYV